MPPEEGAALSRPRGRDRPGAWAAPAFHVHDPHSQVLSELIGAENRREVLFSEATLSQLPRLRYIGVVATGSNIIDVAAAARRGIVVTNVPTYGTRAVAQHAMALLLELTNRVGIHAKGVSAGDWCRSKDWSYWITPLTELDQLTIGIVGRGRIGLATAKLAEAFGMRVVFASSRDGNDGLVRLLRESDVISLHCPLTPETNKLINCGTLRHFKPNALLINTARGALVNEADLAEALSSGQIAGAALDVLSTEPPSPDNPLLHARNCLVTPHVGWAASAARWRLLNIAVENVHAFLQGSPQNRVNQPVHFVSLG